MADEHRLNRRTVLRTGAVAALGLVAGCSNGGSDTPDEEESPEPAGTPTEPDETPEPDGEPTTVMDGASGDFDGWLADTDNYNGVVDRTGESETTVEVGVEANGGNYGYSPAAVRVDTGTTVVWEWTGLGAQHNVVEENAAYESELTSEEGFTFEHTFEEAETSRYYCTPHRSLGMKGVVVVEE